MAAAARDKSPLRRSSVAHARTRPGRTGVVAVLIGRDQVHVLQAAEESGKVVTVRSGAAACGADDGERARAVAAALTEAGINARRIVVCLPARSVTIKRVTLPPASEEQLPALVRYEAQRHLPLPVEQLAVGFQILKDAAAPSSNGSSHALQAPIEALVAVARKEDLSHLERALAGAGLSVEGYGIEPLGVTDAYLAEDASDDGAVRLLLCPDDAGVHAQVLKGRRLLLNRFLAGTGRSWAADLSRFLAGYALEQRDAPIEEAVLIGGTDDTAGGLGLDVPLRRVSRGETGGSAALQGLARQWLGRGEYPLCIEPQGWTDARKAKGPSRTALLAAAALVIVAGLVAWRLDAQRTATRDAARAADVAREVAQERRTLDALTLRRDRLREQILAMGGAAPEAPPLDVLKDIAQRAPSAVWLTQMSYQTGKPVQIEGTTRDVSQAMALVNSLGAMPRFRSVDLGYLRSATVEDVAVTHFRIDCTLANASAAPQSGTEVAR